MVSENRNIKTVLITGAANGIGKELVRKYLAYGWQIIATDSDEPGLQEYRSSSNYRMFKMDVRSDDDVERVFKSLREKGYQLNLIINNAGIDRYFPLSEAPVGKIKEIFEVNVFGAYRVNQVFLPLLAKPGGKIIHIGSESAHLTVPFMPYPLTKNLLERYNRVLRQELRFRGIDILMIKPGAVNTQLLKNVSAINNDISDPLLRRIFSRFTSKAPQEIRTVLEPDEIASFVYRVSLKSRPRAVYRINNSLKLRLIGLLPFWLLEKMIYRRLKGN